MQDGPLSGIILGHPTPTHPPDAPQLHLFHQGMGLGFPVGGIGPFHMGALHQALPRPGPSLVPGQALPTAPPLGNLGVAALGPTSAVGGLAAGAGALDMSSMGIFISQLSVDNSLLKKAKRERDIDVQMALYSNPMSKRAIEQDVVTDMVDSLSYCGQVLQATPLNCVQVNTAIGLVLSAAQTLRDRLAADEEKHLIART